MNNTITNTIVIKGTDAINLTNISETTINQAQSFKPQQDGKYAITITSTATYRSSAPLDSLNQIIIFNTAPLKTGQSAEWFHSINISEGIVVTGKTNEPIYVFIVDQMTSKDNTGEITVSFTLLDK